ncbi:helix-turn-helix domain-containing protein [Dactylosporangium sp. CA-092794]|uniref:GbsR/MarR family transcriptional regulator n=1 Tax=Dactylosporangium sp. CA-092794 TaxID=3239929 RepID=UPI003D89F749
MTGEDRERIAAGLSDGMGYAEIARRLGRPTSTISREVARNGEPGGYWADHAQRAAARRAPRGRPACAARPARTGDGFPESFAVVLTRTGLPRMAARVFACLLTAASESLTAADLVQRLRVSPASVSKAIGYLEPMDLVVRAPGIGSRRERYAVAGDVWQRAWRADTGAHAEVAAAALRGAELVGPDSPAGARLRSMGRFFARLSDRMGGGGLADVVVQDALTVLAALVHAAAPLAAADLAAALGWPRPRVADALAALERRPVLADPLELVPVGSATYAVAARPDRLTPAQRAALRP